MPRTRSHAHVPAHRSATVGSTYDGQRGVVYVSPDDLPALKAVLEILMDPATLADPADPLPEIDSTATGQLRAVRRR